MVGVLDKRADGEAQSQERGRRDSKNRIARSVLSRVSNTRLADDPVIAQAEFQEHTYAGETTGKAQYIYILQYLQTPLNRVSGELISSLSKLHRALICTILFQLCIRDAVRYTGRSSNLLPGRTPTSGCEFTSALLQVVLEAVRVQVRLRVRQLIRDGHAKVVTAITYLETAGTLDRMGRSVNAHEDTSKSQCWRRKDVQDTCTSLSLFLFGQIFLP